MNKFLKIVFLIAMIPSMCFGDCDWSVGIKPLADGGYEYSKVCHQQVGTMVQQISDLQKAVDLKTSALQISDKRIQDWTNTSIQLESQVQKVDTLEKSNEWTFFGLGVATAVAAAIMASQISHIR
jgi:hypothetical protein